MNRKRKINTAFSSRSPSFKMHLLRAKKSRQFNISLSDVGSNSTMTNFGLPLSTKLIIPSTILTLLPETTANPRETTETANLPLHVESTTNISSRKVLGLCESSGESHFSEHFSEIFAQCSKKTCKAEMSLSSNLAQ